MLLAPLLAAVLCTPLPICVDNGNVSPCATPTPTIMWDSDDRVTAEIEYWTVYAKPDDSPSWWWSFRIPYVPANPDPDTGWAESAPGVLQGWPVQRVVPDEVQEQLVDVMVTATNAAGESGPSNVISICMSPICVRPGPCS